MVECSAATGIGEPATALAMSSTRFKWRYAIPLAFGITLFCILIFRVGLGVPLPIFGSWFD